MKDDDIFSCREFTDESGQKWLQLANGMIIPIIEGNKKDESNISGTIH